MTTTPQSTTPSAPTSLSMGRIFRVWWPLAISWMFMTAELPLISAVIARLDNPEINLAAWGIVFSISTIIQAPSTMLLAASTTLSKDWPSYCKLRRIMFGLSLTLTSLHMLVAYTPLFYIVVEGLIGAPPELLEPARLGLMIMLPWSFCTAFRRFQQGVLIQFDHSRAVIWGSMLRMSTDITVLSIGYAIGSLPGVMVGTMAIISGVLAEAVYAKLRVRPVVRDELKAAPVVGTPLTLMSFARFYTPLAMVVLLTLLVQPMVSAALSRMPNAIESLAVWPAVFGLLLMWQSSGISYNEAVIALLDERNAVQSLKRFTRWLAATLSVLLLIMAVTPLAGLWFRYVAALPPNLEVLAQQALLIGVLLPALRVIQSWFQGAITYTRQTRGITESVVMFLVSSSVILWVGVTWQPVTGIYISLLALLVAYILQDVWLWHRSRPALMTVYRRDAALSGG